MLYRQTERDHKGSTMKSASFRSFLFALVLPACGGDHKAPTVTEPAPIQSPVAVKQPVTEATPVAPVEPVKVVEAAVPTTFVGLLTEGRAAADKGDHVRAKEMFDAAIKLDKKSADPHIELVRLYIAMNEKGLAVAEANKAIKLAPTSSLAWNTKGRAELNRFGYDDAIAAFTKAVELNKDNIWAWNNLGYTELQLKKYEDAVEHLGEATSRPGATGYMWNNLGTALEQLDRLDDARQAFDEGGKLGSKEATASRKRLEGVKSIAMAKEDTNGKVEVKPESKSDDHTFDLNEGGTDDGSGEGSGAGSGSGSGSDNSTM